jgi:hypothetical protein
MFLLMSVGCSNTGKDTKQEAKKTSNDSGSGTETKQSGGVIGKAAPDYALTVKEYLAEFKKDKKAAEKKFDGKIVELTGVVASVGMEGAQHPILTFFGDDDEPCNFVTADKEPWVRVAPGQKVKFKGKDVSSYGRPRLVDCVLVDAGKYEAVKVSAAELATEYEKDKTATNSKYHPKAGGKYLVVTGEVASTKTIDDTHTSVFLKGTAKTRINCVFDHRLHHEQGPFLKAVKVGQPMTVFGRYNAVGENDVRLDDCLRITRQ